MQEIPEGSEYVLHVSEYMQSLNEKRCVVVGAGVSNLPLIDLLLNAGNRITVCDRRDSDSLGDIYSSLESRGVTWKLGEKYLEDLDADIVFRTPGLHPQALAEAAARGAQITSEMELFFRFCPCRIIAVTGSDGKTTTSTIISELLKAQGYTVHLGGNIGRPLLEDVDTMRAEDMVVLELSSFQLHSMQCSPDVAVITNISPNHLDVHPDMADYVEAKTMVYTNQSADARVIFNADDPHTPELMPAAPSCTAEFSRLHAVDNGAYALNGDIYIAHNGEAERIMPVSEILLPGLHNVENYLAAFAAVDGLVQPEAMRSVACHFGGVEHRIEFLRELHGVRYYNDSIASSPTRTIAGLHSFEEKPVLIAGGYDKHIPFDELGVEIVKHVKALCLNGLTADKIRAAVEQAPGYDKALLPIYVDADFDASVQRAITIAEEGDVVLMSPACAAFDQFPNFAVRGNHFRSMIMGLE